MEMHPYQFCFKCFEEASAFSFDVATLIRPDRLCTGCRRRGRLDFARTNIFRGFGCSTHSLSAGLRQQLHL